MTSKINSILVVEDNRLIAFQLSQKLGSIGFKVTTAHSGEEAISIVRGIEPDLILMDVNLDGERDGIEIMQAIHEAEGFIPNIYLTGYSESELFKRMEQTSPLSVLEKPVNLETLINTIKSQ